MLVYSINIVLQLQHQFIKKSYVLDNKHRRKRRAEIKDLEKYDNIEMDYQITNQLPSDLSRDYHDNNDVVKYSELLKKMAFDFKLLKLNDIYHCSCSQNQTKELKIRNILLLICLLICNHFIL